MNISLRSASLADVSTLTQIRNDAHATAVAHVDYAWGKEGDGFPNRWVQNDISEKTCVSLSSKALRSQPSPSPWTTITGGLKSRLPATCMGFPCGKVLADAGSGTS